MYNTDHNKLLIDLFENNKEKTYSANYLVKKFSGVINKATIYRQLNKLEENKVIRKSFNEENNTHYYQYANDCDSHLHLTCIKCGKIIHLKCREADMFLSHINLEHEFYIDRYKSVLLGYCKECYNV